MTDIDPSIRELRPSTLEAVDTIDAALFSGDEFVMNPKRRVELRRYIERWHRQLSDLAGMDDDAPV